MDHTATQLSRIVRVPLDWFGAHLWPERHFEKLYSHQPDPWHCETSPYELLKAQRTAHAIAELEAPGPVLDVGCGEGLLADLLGARGYAVTAIDISPSAVERARKRCIHHARVSVTVGNIIRQPVSGRFSVIALSEVLYYLRHGRRRRAICDQLIEALSDEGYIAVTDPWPASRSIERALRMHPRLRLFCEDVFRDPGRPYSLTIYQRLRNE